MNRQAVSTLVIASIVTAGLSGCQSASRWAWWNNRGEGDATVAQSTAPQLPSEGATPQAVEVPGLEPTSSPSAANLAAAQSPVDATNSSLPAASPTEILANVPSATYPADTTSSAAPAAAVSSAASNASDPTAAIASVPPSGPYDPNGYNPSEPLAAAPSTSFAPTAANPLRAASATVDRYAMPNASTPNPQVDPAYAAAASVASNAAATAAPEDRYALPTVAASDSQATGTNSATAAPASKSSPEAAFANSPAPAASQPSAVTNAIDVTPIATATVKLSTPAGKYRPGGTSDYSAAASQPIEVAARPVAAQHSSPATASDPWSPPAASPRSGNGAIGTY